MEEENIIEKIKKRKALLFLFIFIASILAIAWIIHNVFYNGNPPGVLLVALFLLSLLGFLISLFYILQVLIARNKKFVLFFVFVLLVGLIGFWYFYPRFAYKEEFDKYCKKISDIKYKCCLPNNNYDYEFSGRVEHNIELYCLSIGLQYSDLNCYKYQGGGKCIGGKDCDSGYCIPEDINCKNNCSGYCSDKEKPYCDESGNWYYIDDGIVERGQGFGCSPWCIDTNWFEETKIGKDKELMRRFKGYISNLSDSIEKCCQNSTNILQATAIDTLCMDSSGAKAEIEKGYFGGMLPMGEVITRNGEFGSNVDLKYTVLNNCSESDPAMTVIATGLPVAQCNNTVVTIKKSGIYTEDTPGFPKGC